MYTITEVTAEPVYSHMKISPKKYAGLVQELIFQQRYDKASDVLNILAYYGDGYAQTIYIRNLQFISVYVATHK